MVDLLTVIRVKQWPKNLLVFAAPFAAGNLLSGSNLAHSLIAFVSFSMTASTIYILNDIKDRENDRRHLQKRNRAISSGRFSTKSALQLVGILSLSTVAILFWFDDSALNLVIFSYVAIQLTYIYGAKNFPVVELFLLSSGFVLRVLGGGAATQTPVSEWLITVVATSALFIVTGKRYSEKLNMKNDSITRPVLLNYQIDFLLMSLTVFLASTIICYLLWAVELGQNVDHNLALLTAVPFSLAFLNYAEKVHIGGAEAPEEILFSSKSLLGFSCIWLLLFGARFWV